MYWFIEDRNLSFIMCMFSVTHALILLVIHQTYVQYISMKWLLDSLKAIESYVKMLFKHKGKHLFMHIYGLHMIYE